MIEVCFFVSDVASFVARHDVVLEYERPALETDHVSAAFTFGVRLSDPFPTFAAMHPVAV